MLKCPQMGYVDVFAVLSHHASSVERNRLHLLSRLGFLAMGSAVDSSLCLTESL